MFCVENKMQLFNMTPTRPIECLSLVQVKQPLCLHVVPKFRYFNKGLYVCSITKRHLPPL